MAVFLLPIENVLPLKFSFSMKNLAFSLKLAQTFNTTVSDSLEQIAAVEVLLQNNFDSDSNKAALPSM